MIIEYRKLYPNHEKHPSLIRKGTKIIIKGKNGRGEKRGREKIGREKRREEKIDPYQATAAAG